MKLHISKYSAALASFHNKPSPDRYEWLFIIALTIALTLLLHGNALDGYWRFDDGAHLMFATDYSPWQYFFDPAITRAQSGANVTPWNAFFYDLNLSIFGFEPGGFYLHLLLAIASTTLALYALLRLWLPLPSALLGIIVFLTGRPIYHLTQELMNNHYLTGMLFSLLCLTFFTHYIRYGNSIKLLSALVMYALAMTCKEVYVPLIALLFVIPAGNLKQRLMAILPFIVVGIAYALWRHEVLGAWIGGYITNTGEAQFLSILQQLAYIPFLLFNTHGWGLVGLIVVTIMSFIAAWSRLLNIPLVATCVFILFAPLIPLTLFPGISHPDRYLFAPWTAISIWIAVIFQSLRINTTNIGNSLSALVLIIACTQGYIYERQEHKHAIHKAEQLYHFAIESDFSQKALMLDTKANGIYWAFVGSEVRRAYDIAKNRVPQPVLITVNTLNGLLLLDEIILDRQLDLSAIQFLQYSDGFFSTLNIKPLINLSLSQLKAGKDQSLKVILSHNKEALTWTFQPAGISYSAMLWKERPDRLQYSLIDLPDQGTYPLNINDETHISLCYKSPEGWLAVSPKFKLETRQEMVWQGKTDLSQVTDKLESLLLRLDR